MSNKHTNKTLIQKIGIILFSIAFAVFLAIPFLGKYKINLSAVEQGLNNKDNLSIVSKRLATLEGQTITNPFTFVNAYKAEMKKAQEDVKKHVEETLGLTTSDGDYWNKILQDWEINQSAFQVAKASASGMIVDNWGLLFFLTIILGIIGALMYILPKFSGIPGIKNNHIYHSGMHNRGVLGILAGVFLVGFYVFLYFYPEYIVNWVVLTDPVSKAISGNGASQWFLYGFLYTICILVMGIRMFAKYRHNNYQLIRTSSVMFFQLAFAFLIPEILVSLNQPYMDFKNIWPLDYDFFFEWNINGLISNGGLGIFMLFWGIMLVLVAVPVITYFYGKRWYCSWVCGCGGLAETLGDPYRQLSDKSLGAWKIERWLIHSVLVFAVVMTGMVLYTYFTGEAKILGLDSFKVRKWYGFAIGSMFSGVIGTGFYPWFGNRVWCRFGCPLAAYLGIVQKFRSRFRITTNGSQCISCGNCSTYCEMGIDVRSYAQKGQDIVRASCVGCGVCAAVCPRGVLRLENSGLDVGERTDELRTIHISENEVKILA